MSDLNEHPAAKRMRMEFEAKYGEASNLMRAANRWFDVRTQYNDAWNRDRERPITLEDVEAAEREMLAARAQPAQAVPPDVVRDADVEAAAKKMAEIFDYPWDFMPEKGRNTMRENVRAVLDAAIAQQKGQP